MQWLKDFLGRKGRDTIVVAIDIGTTTSGVSFTCPSGSTNPMIHRVMHSNGWSSIIPTLVWYDRTTMEAKLCGSAAVEPSSQDRARKGHWELAENFKSDLHPTDMTQLINPSPRFDVKKIYAGFMKYLLSETLTSIRNLDPPQKDYWNDYKSSIKLVIAHPNGWKDEQKEFLRTTAAAAASASLDVLISKDKDIFLVTEAEASLHFCMFSRDPPMTAPSDTDTKLIVCDAGGSTIDITKYQVTDPNPKELKFSQVDNLVCKFAGGVKVDEKAKEFFVGYFSGSGVASAEALADMAVRSFRESAKVKFEDPADPPTIFFGDEAADVSCHLIDNCTMKLTNDIVRPFFQPVVHTILESLGNQMLDQSAKYCIYLVGGFGRNRFLRTQLQKEFRNSANVQVVAEHMQDKRKVKEVADGALAWYARKGITSYTSGTLYEVFHNKSPGESQAANGTWQRVLQKGDVVNRDTPKKNKYLTQTYHSRPAGITVPLFACDPEHQDRREVGTLRANIGSNFTWNHRRFSNSLKLQYSVVIAVADNGFKAYIRWKVDATTGEGEASYIPLRYNFVTSA